MKTPSKIELAEQSFQAHWCEHCRCVLTPSQISDTQNHKRCGKGPVELLRVISLPIRDFQ